MAHHILVLHGPNLNLLGTREPDVYGRQTLAEINGHLQRLAAENGARCQCFQSNHEGELVDRIQSAAGDQTDLIIVNAAAYTHTSLTFRHALAPWHIPVIGVY